MESELRLLGFNSWSLCSKDISVYIVYEERSVVTSYLLQTKPCLQWRFKSFAIIFWLFLNCPCNFLSCSPYLRISYNRKFGIHWSISPHVLFKKLLFYFIKTLLCSGITPDGSLVTKLDTRDWNWIGNVQGKILPARLSLQPLSSFFFLSFFYVFPHPY